jgi:hypothetical protein
METDAILDTLRGWSMESWQAEEIGDCNEAPGAWAAKFPIAADESTDGKSCFVGLAGCILYCDSQGFYSYDSFTDSAAFETHWSHVVSELTIVEEDP